MRKFIFVVLFAVTLVVGFAASGVAPVATPFDGSSGAVVESWQYGITYEDGSAQVCTVYADITECAPSTVEEVERLWAEGGVEHESASDADTNERIIIPAQD